MSVFSTIMILILIGSAAVCLFTIRRVVIYNRKYHLPESKYTRLFGILTKEHIVAFYIIFVILNIFVGIWFILTV